MWHGVGATMPCLIWKGLGREVAGAVMLNFGIETFCRCRKQISTSNIFFHLLFFSCAWAPPSTTCPQVHASKITWSFLRGLSNNMFSKSFESSQKTQQQIGLAANNVLKRAKQCFKTGPMSAQSGALSQMAKGSACVAGREVEIDVELSYN